MRLKVSRREEVFFSVETMSFILLLLLNTCLCKIGVVIALRGILVGLVSAKFNSTDREITHRIFKELKLVAMNDKDELNRNHAKHILNEMKHFARSELIYSMT